MSKKVKDLFDLSGKTAVITGGAGLLGEKHAEAIAEFGGIPVLLDLNGKLAEEKAKRIVDEFGTACYGYQCDITKKIELEKVKDWVLDEWGQINILINNAAIDPKVTKSGSQEQLTRLEHFSLDQWNLELAVGLTGAFLCAQVFGTEMAKQGSGVIVNIASDLALIGPDQRIYRRPDLPEEQQPAKPVSYSVTKAGLLGLTRYLATYWAPKGVRVNAVSLGGIYTTQDDEFVQRLSNLIPLGRMAHQDEYKAAIVFLVSDASSYMTGANLSIDGGRTAW